MFYFFVFTCYIQHLHLTVTEKESGRPPRPGRKKYDLKGKKLFENPETSSDEETPPPSESEDAAEEDDDEDDNTPLFHVRQSMRRSAVSNRNAQTRPSPAATQATPAEPDSTQAAPAEITLEEQGGLDSGEAFHRGPLSPDKPLMIGSATEELIPDMQFGGDTSTTPISGESNKVRIQHFLVVFCSLEGTPSCLIGISLSAIKFLS